MSRCGSKLRDYSTNYSSNYSIRFRVSTHPAIFKYYSKNPCFSAAAKFTVTDEMTRVISARDRLKWGTFGPLFLLKRHGDLSFLKYFQNTYWWGTCKNQIKSRTNCTNRLQEVPAFWRSLSRK